MKLTDARGSTHLEPLYSNHRRRRPSRPRPRLVIVMQITL